MLSCCAAPVDIGNRHALLTSSFFWNQVKAENVLMFDTTTVLCASSPHSISEFASKFDYVGAPWKWAVRSADAARDTEFTRGGNGMLSFRRKSTMLKVTAAFNRTDMNEDMWFVRHLGKIGARLSDAETGVRFAVEELPYERPFGVSYGMRTVPKAERAKILKQCPEARVLVGYLPGASWVIDHMDGTANGCEGLGAQTTPPCPEDG